MSENAAKKDEIERIITDTEYNFLMRFNEKELSEVEHEKLKFYRSAKRKKIITPQVIEYNKKLLQKKEKPVLTYDNLLKAFKQQFKIQEKVPFDEQQLENINTVLYYFTKDERFFDCKNLSDKSKPSFDKGILLVGSFGTGKSVTMSILSKLFNNTPLVFSYWTANDIVTEYEGLENVNDKKQFFESTSLHVRYFDDLKTERHASNFGKVNLFKEILEKRVSNRVKTYGSCNYTEDDVTNNLNKGLFEFQDKYGGRVYDRLFDMFNIIEFHGKSMRI